MASGTRISIKASRLTKMMEAKKNEEMAADSTAAATAATAGQAMETNIIPVVAVGSPPPTQITRRKNSQSSQDIRIFLQAAASGGQVAASGGQGADVTRTPAKRGREADGTPPADQQAAKKTAQEEGEGMGDVEDKLEAMRQKIVEKAGLSPQQVAMVMEVVTEGIKEILQSYTRETVAAAAKEATKAATEAAREEASRYREADRCKRSIIMHNADRWVGNSNNGYGLAENITAQIHRCMAHTVLVLDAFSIGQWVDNKPPSSVFVTFGSVAQKATFFRVLARTIQERKTGWEQLKGISCRDAFPKEYIMESKRLAQKGFALRQNGKAAAFRVVARGAACIPVLEVRAAGAANGARGRWDIFRTVERPQPVVPQPGTAAAAAVATAATAATTPPNFNRTGRRDTPRKTGGNEDIVRLPIDDMDFIVEY